MDNRDKQIMDYLEGRLTPEEVINFQAEMEADAELRAEISDYQKMLRAFKEKRLEEKRKKIRELRKNRQPLPEMVPVEEEGEKVVVMPIAERPGDKKVYGKYWRLASGLSVAASLALIMMWVFIWQPRADMTELADEENTLTIYRGTSSTDEDLFQDGLAYFNSQEYGLAIQKLSEISARDSINYISSQYLLGLAYYHRDTLSRSKRYALVEAYLKNALDNIGQLRLIKNMDNDPSFIIEAEDINWFRALNALKNGQKKQAEAALQILANQAGKYQNKALEKLERLNR